MFRNLTLNSIFWLFLGVGLIGSGGYVFYKLRMPSFMAGLVFLGLGSILCGITNGFTDYSRNGRLFWKIGAISLMIGLLLTGFSLFKFA